VQQCTAKPPLCRPLANPCCRRRRSNPVPSLQDAFKGQGAHSYSVGEAVFWEGDQASHIFDVREGVLRVCKLLPDGRRAIVGFIYPGDVLGVSFQSRYLFTAEAVTAVKIRRLPRAQFFDAVNGSPPLRPQLFALLCDEMSAAQDQMLLLGRKRAEERVVSFLLAVQRKTAIGKTIELPMSRLDVADYLGLTIETVSRMMTGLTRQGLIAATGRHSVCLRRPAALRAIAGIDVGLDIVAAISMTAALAVGETLAAAVVALMYSGGQYLEKFAEGRARRRAAASAECPADRDLGRRASLDHAPSGAAEIIGGPRHQGRQSRLGPHFEPAGPSRDGGASHVVRRDSQAPRMS
jgi:CRP/FNR family transcriptional regulator